MPQPVIVWFRQDLRLEDNPALTQAASLDAPVIPLYIYDEKWMGTAQKVWLHHSLRSLKKKIPLILRKGDTYSILNALQRETKAQIFSNRCYEPHAIEIESKLKNIETFKANLLIEPWEISPKTSEYYKVFTPFWNECMKVLQPEKPLPQANNTFYSGNIESDEIEELKLLPKDPDFVKGIESFWKFGEEEAKNRLEIFIEESLKSYETRRDLPAIDATSRLSPHLHFGEISPRQIWYRIKGIKGAGSFLRQLGWREFCHHLLYHFPEFPTSPFDSRFSKFKWDTSTEYFNAWTQGKTGYPIIDAGMRQLSKIGWMHNRVRMIAASFLTKDLLIPWQEGEQWFWEMLVDADLANNSGGWQWVAGCGADAAPYFRIFNPILQGKKFDPDGEYIKKWVPELKKLDPKHIHEPWKYEGFSELDYPAPIVDHSEAREEALRRYAAVKH